MMMNMLRALKRSLGKINTNQLKDDPTSLKKVMGRMPLMLDEKTYNTSHPNYNSNLVRNFPGRIFNRESSSKNKVYQALSSMTKKGDEICDSSWQKILDDMLNEIKQVPFSSQILERKSFIENYVADLSQRYRSHYMPGWVNIVDAIFLYWLVRMLKPKTIVQTGVCNGLSAAFMVLGLIKNGNEGRIYLIDLPPVFNPHDPAWTATDQVYGVVIPEGKTTGWIVPDAYRDRIEVQNGDAKQLLPQLVDRLDNIDLFFHDSDHTYNHMMFEFAEAKRKLSPGGVIVADDISWNESLWDFADQYQVPAYNYKGTIGAAFF